MTRTFLHVGCGRKPKHNTTPAFAGNAWREVRFDIAPETAPDIVGDMRAMTALADASFDAVYSAHNIEHVYITEAAQVLSEFRRVLKPDGFLILTCPDLKSIAALAAEDRLEDPMYLSPAGPIAPIDAFFGHRPALARGDVFMAHKSGFTLKTLSGHLMRAGFAGLACFERGAPFFDLWAAAVAQPTPDDSLRTLAMQHFPRAEAPVPADA